MNLSFVVHRNSTGAEGDVVADVHKTVGQVDARFSGHARPWYQRYYVAHFGCWDATLLPLNDLNRLCRRFRARKVCSELPDFAQAFFTSTQLPAYLLDLWVRQP
jgi:hypothetical protein